MRAEVTTRTMIDALLKRHNCRVSSNTRVDEQGNVYLFDNHIARRNPQIPARYEFNLCGWHTVTTIQRINAIIDAFGGDKLWLRKGQAYRGDVEAMRHLFKAPKGVNVEAHVALHTGGARVEPLPRSDWFPARMEH